MTNDVATVTLTVSGVQSETWYAIEEHPPAGWTIETLNGPPTTPAADGSLRIACIQALGCSVQNWDYVYTVQAPSNPIDWTFWGIYQFESDPGEMNILGGTELPCSVDADCDNGLFCDGSETCSAGVCEAGTPPSNVLSNTAIVGPVTHQACGTLSVGPSVTISGGPVVLRAESGVVFIDPVTVDANAGLQVELGSPIP